MSGVFDYHLRCEDCDLCSRIYPFLYTDWSRTEIVRPVFDYANGAFDRIVLPVRMSPSGPARSDSLEGAYELARVASTPTRTIAHPKFGVGPTQVRFEPALGCPRCGGTVIAALGGPGPAVRPWGDAAHLVAQTRELPAGRDVKFVAPTPRLRVICRWTYDGRGARAWEIRHAQGAPPTALIAALRQAIAAAGGAIVEEDTDSRRVCFEEIGGEE